MYRESYSLREKVDCLKASAYNKAMAIGKKPTGGKKAKRAKKVKEDTGVERPLIFKETCQEYAYVEKMLGDCRVAIRCADDKNRLGHIRGTMTKRRKVFINPGDVVLCGLREYEDAKADIMYLYNKKEVKRLISMAEIPVTFLDAEPERADEDLGFEIVEDYGDSETEEAKAPSGVQELDSFVDAL